MPKGMASPKMAENGPLAECGYREDLARRVVVEHAHDLASLRPLSPPCPYDLTDEELKAASDKRRAEQEQGGE